jgi:hypothetical protein
VLGFDHVDGSEGYVLSPILDAGERLSFDAGTEAPVDRGPPPGPRTPQAETQVFIEHLGAFVPAPLASLLNQTGKGKATAVSVGQAEFVTIEPTNFAVANDEEAGSSGLIDWSARTNKLKQAGRR